MQASIRCLAAIAVFLAFGGRCYAETLPDAAFTGIVSVDCRNAGEPIHGFRIDQPGTTGGSVSCLQPPYTGNWSGSATVSGKNNGTLSASLSGNGYGVGSASAQVQYWFTLVGGQTGSMVPVTIETNGSETWSGGGTSFALVFTISSASGDEYHTVVYDPGIHFSSFHSLNTFDFVVGKQYRSDLLINIFGAGNYDLGPLNGSQSVFLDPVYSPAAGSGVTIEFSQNLPVPEPARWATLIAGVPLVGLMRHRRLRLSPKIPTRTPASVS